jgi:hypothetical protein
MKASRPAKDVARNGFRDWSAALDAAAVALAGGDAQRKGYLDADVDMVLRAVRGLGPDDPQGEASDHGVRVVFNISSARVPEFCVSGYQNAYAFQKYRLAEDYPGEPPGRVKVDTAVAAFFEVKPNQIHYGAVDLNGSGVRFYGDICLVLHPSAVTADTDILDRNSYDLLRKPFRDRFAQARTSGETGSLVRQLAGRWSSHLSYIVALKVLQSRIGGHRRLTTGHVSLGILDDEDYVEVARQGGFRTGDLEAARGSSADAAREAFIDAVARSRQILSLEEFNWRIQRREARMALASYGVPFRIVSFAGRTRT